ncbi:MAG TPA: cytochrome d ubiquinol oxidase subunit II, partial [Verrucomicrobiae bacterium]|nr:cytochrome d ubiquinol oxidase subunit II [Verrucomicrobiae bacterium]
FAAFPQAYATVFSGFYTPFMILLFALIFRGVSIEFRGKHNASSWRAFWDVSFCVASALATFLFGVAVGNAMRGMPIGPDMEFKGTFWSLLHPYALLVGAFAVATFAMHGSIYLYLKTEGELQQRIREWTWRTFGIFLVVYLFTTIYTLVNPALAGPATANFRLHPRNWLVVVLNVLAIANIPRAIHLGRPGYAFASSCATVAALTFLFGVALFPDLIHSSLNPDWSLTIYNAASSKKTLEIMAIMAALGLPFVLAYTSVVYWVFRGKVQLGKFSY